MRQLNVLLCYCSPKLTIIVWQLSGLLHTFWQKVYWSTVNNTIIVFLVKTVSCSYHFLSPLLKVVHWVCISWCLEKLNCIWPVKIYETCRCSSHWQMSMFLVGTCCHDNFISPAFPLPLHWLIWLGGSSRNH